MGLFTKINDELPNQFSIFQVMKILEMEETDLSEARNILKQWHQMKLVRRVSKNMYLKVGPNKQ